MEKQKKQQVPWPTNRLATPSQSVESPPLSGRSPGPVPKKKQNGQPFAEGGNQECGYVFVELMLVKHQGSARCMCFCCIPSEGSGVVQCYPHAKLATCC